MGKRLVLSLGGAALGAFIASRLEDTLGFSPADLMAICAIAGMAVGYVFSTLLEVFTAKPEPLSAIRPDVD